MKNINALPKIDFQKCTGCTKCVGVCPGLAIFVVKVKGDQALITLPYEFLPIPKIGDVVDAVDREGSIRGKAKVIRVSSRGETTVITIQVEKSLAMQIRMIKVNP
jgi:Fe-S-cluster-containing hydrogenase component 2